MLVPILVAAVAAAVIAVAIGRGRARLRPGPVKSSWRWEGIRLEGAAVEAPSPPSVGAPGGRGRSRLVIRGEYMARPSIYRAAASDWAFSSQPTPVLVLHDATRGVEIHRASLDRIRAEYQARVQGLSISYAMPPPVPVSDDETRREGAPFAVDIGFYLEPRAEPWELRVHAELGPLRSAPISIVIAPASAAPTGRAGGPG